MPPRQARRRQTKRSRIQETERSLCDPLRSAETRPLWPIRHNRQYGRRRIWGILVRIWMSQYGWYILGIFRRRVRERRADTQTIGDRERHRDTDQDFPRRRDRRGFPQGRIHAWKSLYDLLGIGRKNWIVQHLPRIGTSTDTGRNDFRCHGTAKNLSKLSRNRRTNYRKMFQLPRGMKNQGNNHKDRRSAEGNRKRHEHQNAGRMKRMKTRKRRSLHHLLRSELGVRTCPEGIGSPLYGRNLSCRSGSRSNENREYPDSRKKRNCRARSNRIRNGNTIPPWRCRISRRTEEKMRSHHTHWGCDPQKTLCGSKKALWGNPPIRGIETEKMMARRIFREIDIPYKITPHFIGNFYIHAHYSYA